MILKVNDTDKHNISMDLCVDWENQEISVKVEHWDKVKHSTSGYGYPAEEFPAAIAKFNKLEKEYIK